VRIVITHSTGSMRPGLGHVLVAQGQQIVLPARGYGKSVRIIRTSHGLNFHAIGQGEVAKPELAFA
jgi:hypothetical protein